MMRFGGAAGLAAAALLVLSGCAIEVGPPPETDPPLVPPEAKGPPPPAQPTEPQAWSRDLDFSAAPAATNSEKLQDGLVAARAEGVTYSRQSLTYQSAFNDEKPPSEAEQARQRARERATAAGLPPPPSVAAVPVAEVREESLPPGRGEAAPAQEASAAEPATTSAETYDESRWESSRLPPPPKFPTTLGQEAATSEEATPSEAVEGAAEPAAAAATPPQVAEALEQEASQQAAAAEPEALLPETASGPTDRTGDFVAEAWDAPSGTILVQVSAVQKKASVPGEWDRLRERFPGVLSSLRLVIDEARLGEKGVFYRVQAGGFDNQEVAAAACDSLISQGQACFVVVR